MLTEPGQPVARRPDLMKEKTSTGQPWAAMPLLVSPTTIDSIDLLDTRAGALADTGVDVNAGTDDELPTTVPGHTPEAVRPAPRQAALPTLARSTGSRRNGRRDACRS